MACLDAQTRVTAAGLSSGAAMAFFETMPKVEMLMPPLELRVIEDMMTERRSDRRPRYLPPSYED